MKDIESKEELQIKLQDQSRLLKLKIKDNEYIFNIGKEFPDKVEIGKQYKILSRGNNKQFEPVAAFMAKKKDYLRTNQDEENAVEETPRRRTEEVATKEPDEKEDKGRDAPKTYSYNIVGDMK